MNNYYSPWYKASRDIARSGVDARCRSGEDMGTSFAGKPCVRSSRKAAISVMRKKARQKAKQHRTSNR